MRWHGGNAMAIRRAGHVVFLAAVPTAADAQASPTLFNDDVNLGQIVLLAALIGAVTFAVLATIQLIRALCAAAMACLVIAPEAWAMPMKLWS